MPIDLTRFSDTYFEEAREHMARLEEGLLQLERDTGDEELLNTIFRCVHSIKGSGGVFGFDDIVGFAHKFEGVLDRLREGTLTSDSGLVQLLLTASDCLNQLLDAAREGEPAPASIESTLAELSRYLEGHPPHVASTSGGADRPPGGGAYQIHIRPNPDLMRTGSDPFLLLRDLEELGTIEDLTVDGSELPSLRDLDPERCYLAWSLRLRTDAGEDAIRDVFAFVEDSCDLSIEAETDPAGPVREGTSDPTSSGRPNAAASGTPRTDVRPRAMTTIRVSTEKVDELINLVGELIISRSIVRQVLDAAEDSADPLLSDAVDNMERNIRDLQDRVLSVRMVPVEMLFNRFPRLVHDLGVSCRKDIALELSGEDTELDKGVIERMVDPLTHLLRNAVDHGVEAPEERIAAGKPERATIRLSARAEAGAVIIDITDDGAGLDRERIRAKAEGQGLIGPDDELTDDELCSLIFEAGFSTAVTVSDISGRGVGMDVVRRNVEALNGTVAVSSAPGRGTTFRVKLPLTLAILEGMQLRVHDQVFVLPLLAIVESLRLSDSSIQTVVGKGEVVTVRGQTLPLVRLSRILGSEEARPDAGEGLAIVIEHEGRKVALLAHELLDQTQIVVKNLEANYRRVDGIMGATILGDGRVALILDVGGLVRLGRRARAGSRREELVSA